MMSVLGMEGRKIQRVGRATLAVSLPRSWVKEAGVKQGDLVFCIPQKDGSLNVMLSTLAERKAEAKEYIVNSDLCNETGILERIIVGNYVLGRDTIRVVSAKRIKPAHVAEVQRIVRKLMGLGIIEETPTQIILQCSIDPAKFPIPVVMRRLYIIASTMHKEAVQALVDSDRELAEGAARREDDADMIYWLIVRLLFMAQRDRAVADQMGIEDPSEIAGGQVLAALLERIADWGENMARNVVTIEDRGLQLGKQTVDRLSRISEMAYNVCYSAMECVYTGNVELANSAIETFKKTIEAEEDELMKRLPVEIPNSYAVARLTRIAWGIRRIAELGAEIAEIAINRSLTRSSQLCEET
jgi:phosphate uptake regulator